MTHLVLLVDDADRPLARFRCAPGQTVLDAAVAAGVVMPAGCRHGACRTCTARLRAGRIHMPDGTAMTPELLADHLVLPCVTTVSSDAAFQVDPDGGPLTPELVRPWTD